MRKDRTRTVSDDSMITIRHHAAARVGRLAAMLAAALIAAAALGAGRASADFGFSSFSFAFLDQNGQPYTQAGGHPYEATAGFQISTDQNGNPAQNIKDLSVDLPPGFIGDPSATPKCTVEDLNNLNCAASTQVGVVHLDTISGPFLLGVYNMVPPAGMPAQFAFKLVTNNIYINARVLTGGGYALASELSNISALVPVIGSTLTLWGVPADPSHDAERGACLSPFGGGPTGQLCPSGVPSVPFLRMPTSCTGQPLTTTAEVDTWQDPGDFKHASATAPALTGCERLDFSPTIRIQPDTSAADSPSGLSVDLRVPQNDNPSGAGEADLRAATVTLPAGVSVDPSSADGLAACSPAQIGIDNASEPACPDASKIGSVQVQTPLLPDPLTGAIYVAQQNQNPFGSLLAIYVTAEADGSLIKLAGHVIPDPVTGQLTTTFDNNPQLPFTEFKLEFFGGPHGVLATPQQCGTYTTNSSLSPWSGTPTVNTSDSFAITRGCQSGFSPTFAAGTQNAQAGAYTPFVLSFSRSDTDQDFQGLSVSLPEGMLAKLAGVAECSDAQLAAAGANTGAREQAVPSCPSSSQVGTVQTGAGTGPDPFFLGGKAYLTGPYKGGPYGLAVIVPAVAGPYDLGTVVVRQALYIDPTTAQVTAVSDQFPTILQGIPLRIRSISVNLDRPQFTLAPTSCDPTAVTGTLTSTGGLSAPASARFQVGGCSSLGFSPKLKLALSGKGKTHSGNHPTLTATLTDPSGQANIRSARVALPLSMALDVNNSKNVCAFATAQAVHGASVGCPASTIVGTATAQTPLLSQPLTGKVYLVQGIRFGKNGQAIHTLPSLLIPLRGQIALDLRAQSAVSGGKLVTTFATIPDAPVSKFTLKINGGRKGILVITGRGKTICGKKQVSNATLGAQSGKSHSMAVTMSKPCGPAAKHKTAKPKKKGGAKGHAV